MFFPEVQEVAVRPREDKIKLAAPLIGAQKLYQMQVVSFAESFEIFHLLLECIFINVTEPFDGK